MSKDRNSGVPASGRYSPLRYPGGKGKLARFIAKLVRENSLSDGVYAEPYAGGAAIAWELLLTGVVRRVEVNDINRPVYSFWKSVLNETEQLLKLVKDTPVSLESWDKHKKVIMNPSGEDDISVGFAMFFLNRTNRSGILNGGVIGGRKQEGQWKIDARYNKVELASRIERIAMCRHHIRVSNQDALQYLRDGKDRWGKRTLVYLDPPYYEKGSHLYYDYYRNDDHQDVSECIRSMDSVSWIVSYDDVLPIQNLYSFCQSLQYTIGYSARNILQGREAMFFSDNLAVPSATGSMRELNRAAPGMPMIAPRSAL
jgi:DNA adenine methylase